jgi:murein DD-endopeptidase MepM/ murein hydrolase activator NlpD
VDTYLPGKPGEVYIARRFPAAPRGVPRERVLFARHSYNNPVKYVDPSGHRVCLDASRRIAVDPISGQVEAETAPLSHSEKISSLPTSGRFYLMLERLWISGYGFSISKNHPGVDYGEPSDDTVRAQAFGIVIIADSCHLDDCIGPYPSVSPETNGGYGNVIVIEYPGLSMAPNVRTMLGIDQSQSVFVLTGHLEESPDLQPGDTVYPGQPIGNVGNTGNSTGPHLHYSMRVAESGHLPYGRMCIGRICSDTGGMKYALYERFRAMPPIDPTHIQFSIGHPLGIE